ncbi:arsenate reductase (glutaredoxin) [Marinospirillum sp.]|uniref:arsenate reductase (glutaredoxin) n=1 Tax=Marinospirillum sp. TaxID=2183934 RepID=UPI0025B7E4EE|nr:arsenate reductase (glutaredoxin) [Marinospirillum sp.]
MLNTNTDDSTTRAGFMPFTLYHNPRCSKSRQALQLLQEQGIEPQLRKYLDEPLNLDELKQLLSQLDMTPRQLMRTGEEIYRELDLANTELDDAQLLDALLQHPRLIERPILSNGKQALVGRPPEQVLQLLK